MCSDGLKEWVEYREGCKVKDFNSAFDQILTMIEKKENFAFTRFSDGELFIMQNKTVVLADNHYITGDVKGPNRKSFILRSIKSIAKSFLSVSAITKIGITRAFAPQQMDMSVGIILNG